MPPRVSITKDAVLKAAFEIVREDGSKDLTARRIAKELDCSTAPVYSTFKNMAELAEEVMRMAIDLMVEYTRREYSDIPFLNMGVGIVLFSRENKNLYSDLFLRGDRYAGILDALQATMLEMFLEDPRHDDLPDDLRRALLTKMWTFTHGMASLTCVSLLKDDSDENIMRLLSETGRAVIMDTYVQTGMTDIGIWQSLCPETKG